jgi:hypothetical protein
MHATYSPSNRENPAVGRIEECSNGGPTLLGDRARRDPGAHPQIFDGDVSTPVKDDASASHVVLDSGDSVAVLGLYSPLDDLGVSPPQSTRTVVSGVDWR